ncbi:hypothetical protein [Embleya sp. NPDC005971]|uniref:hypothetical protein n=1 Tax=Embleya sp. NPDC005971 TaxID=3156724 RepID=UPI00340761AD
MAEIQWGSVEELQVPDIRANGSLVQAGSVTAEIALGPLGSPRPASPVWAAADWPAAGVAQVLIGPGQAIDPERGEYVVYLRLTDPPQIPILRSGRLSVQ